MMKMKIVLEANVPDDLDRCAILPEYFLKVEGHPPIEFVTNYDLLLKKAHGASQTSGFSRGMN